MLALGGALVLGYITAAKLGVQFATTDGGVTAVWPASGIALAFLLRFGHQLWPWVLIAAALGSASLSVSFLAAGAEGLAATAQAVVAVGLLRRFAFNPELRRLRDVGVFLAVVPVGGAVAAAIGVAGLAATGIVDWSQYASIAAVWFVGDTLGAVVVAPILLVWGRPGRDPAGPRWAEAMGLGVTVGILGLVVFGDVLPALPAQQTAFVMVPPVVWAGVRFGRRGAVTVVGVVALMVIGATARSSGPFGQGELGASLLVAQLFVGVLAGTALSLAAVSSERRVVTAALQRKSASSEAQQRFLHATLDNLADAVVACDADGRLTVFNRATRELHGLPAEPVPPSRWAEHYSLYAPDGTSLMRPEDVPLVRALRGEHVKQAELVVVPKNGAARRLLASGQPITSDDGRRVGAVIAMHDVTERKALEEQLRHQAFHDPLTGLANRALFRDRVEHALLRRHDGDETLAVLFLDLDDFKAVNDTLGHQAGDEALVLLGKRLQHEVRAADTVARFGGDEFAILLEQDANSASVIRTADRILRSLRAPMTVDGRQVSLPASMGIAFSDGAHESAETLLRNADLAMYRAKEAGKGRHEIFESGMRTAALEQLAMKADLELAVQRRQFTLHYQPIVDLQSGAVAGVEALVRWRHPTRGMVAPAEFISFAEQTGAIVPIGRWVLKQACRQVAAWQQRAGTSGPLMLTVNVSGRQLRDDDMEADVTAALSASGLTPDALTLEITESVLIDDPEGAVDKLEALRRLGVRVAIDDFGTGYSSLSYLTRFPIGILKIDKTFVDTIEAGSRGSAVARVIVELGRTLGLIVVAEGIERPEQAEALRQMGCQLGQGYLFGRPMHARAAGLVVSEAGQGDAPVSAMFSGSSSSGHSPSSSRRADAPARGG